MRLFDLIAVFIVMAAGFGYLNFRLLKLPTTIGLMALSLLFSLSLFVLGAFVPAVAQQTHSVIEQFDFNQVLLHGMLAFLLFAGALHIDLGDLARHKEPIALLATVGVLLSTLIVGVLMWGVFALLGFKLRFIDCLLFGALISPTDPIAVLSLLKKIGAPKTLEVQIAGESLFNDGIGVVLFMGLLEVATGENDFDVGHFAFLFIREAVGGPCSVSPSGWWRTGCSSRWTTIRSRSSCRWRWSGAARLWPTPSTCRLRSPWWWLVY